MPYQPAKESDRKRQLVSDPSPSARRQSSWANSCLLQIGSCHLPRQGLLSLELENWLDSRSRIWPRADACGQISFDTQVLSRLDYCRLLCLTLNKLIESVFRRRAALSVSIYRLLLANSEFAQQETSFASFSSAFWDLWVVIWSLSFVVYSVSEHPCFGKSTNSIAHGIWFHRTCHFVSNCEQDYFQQLACHLYSSLHFLACESTGWEHHQEEERGWRIVVLSCWVCLYDDSIAGNFWIGIVVPFTYSSFICY